MATKDAEVARETFEGFGAAGTAQEIADRQVVRTALRAMPVEHRHVLLECCFRGASVADAAEILGVPSDTIRSRAHYALHALRHAIDDRARM